MLVGNRIKEFRLKCKLTQNKLSEKSGINASTIKKYESGERNPKRENLEKIAKALTVDVEAFYIQEASDVDNETRFNLQVVMRNESVEKETVRLKKLFSDIPDKQKKLVSGLILQAARLKVLLDEMWIDITENGDYESFTQSENTPPYEKERPVAKLFNNRDASYQKIIKQLSDYLPEEKKKEVIEAASDGSDLM